MGQTETGQLFVILDVFVAFKFQEKTHGLLNCRKVLIAQLDVR